MERLKFRSPNADTVAGLGYSCVPPYLLRMVAEGRLTDDSRSPEEINSEKWTNPLRTAGSFSLPGLALRPKDFEPWHTPGFRSFGKNPPYIGSDGKFVFPSDSDDDEPADKEEPFEVMELDFLKAIPVESKPIEAPIHDCDQTWFPVLPLVSYPPAHVVQPVAPCFVDEESAFAQYLADFKQNLSEAGVDVADSECCDAPLPQASPDTLLAAFGEGVSAVEEDDGEWMPNIESFSHEGSDSEQSDTLFAEEDDDVPPDIGRRDGEKLTDAYVRVLAGRPIVFLDSVYAAEYDEYARDMQPSRPFDYGVEYTGSSYPYGVTVLLPRGTRNLGVPILRHPPDEPWDYPNYQEFVPKKVLSTLGMYWKEPRFRIFYPRQEPGIYSIELTKHGPDRKRRPLYVD